MGGSTLSEVTFAFSWFRSFVTISSCDSNLNEFTFCAHSNNAHLNGHRHRIEWH
jgi:hypothetical protein